MGTRTCFSCKVEKPLTSEFFYRSNVRYFQNECKDCNRVQRAKYWKSPTGKTSAANTKLKLRFGLSLADYESMSEKQDGKCRICGATESTGGHRLAVDHCHSTGNIRGLLCKACNAAIGNLRDNPTFCMNAASYLKEFQ